MRKATFYGLASLTILLSVKSVAAQNTSPYWSLAGNSNATTSSKLGTANNIPLLFLTKNLERLRVDTSGRVGIGTTSPTDRLTLNSASGMNAFRAQVNGSTKLLVQSGGGVSIGSGTTAPANGLYVLGMVGIGTASPQSRFQVNSAAGESPFSAQINGVTKLVINSNGGFAVGSNAPAPANGLYVSGNVGIGTTNPLSKLQINVNGTDAYAGLAITNTNSGGRTLSINQGTPGKLNFTQPGILDLMTMDFTNGYVGIGTVTPNAQLDIQCPNRLTGINLNSGSFGIFTSATGSGIGVRAIEAQAFSSGQEAFGVIGDALGGSGNGNNYGIWGFASGGAFNAAGYFKGDVYAISYNNISDRKFKTSILPLKNSLQLLMSLKPSSYQFKKDDNIKMGLPAGKQMGLIADEVKQVFPELVKEAVQPAEYGKDRTKVLSPEVKYESVNYIGLIPVLIASVQEQQKQIEVISAKNDEKDKQINDLQSQINELKSLISKGGNGASITSSTGSSYLKQNVPNPAKNNTVINYHLNNNRDRGQIIITDQKGSTLKVFNASKNEGQVNIRSGELPAGTYIYSLYVNDKRVDSKQMVITK